MNFWARFSSVFITAIVFSYQTTSLTVASTQTVPTERHILAKFTSIQDPIQVSNEGLIVQESTVESGFQHDVELRLAKRFTVKIKLPGGTFLGSGVIIAKEDRTYYVLTAKHVVEVKNQQYKLETYDGSEYLIEPNQVSRALGEYRDGDLDLALLSFTSDNHYSVAKMANPLSLAEENFVALYGWNPSKPEELEINAGEIEHSPYSNVFLDSEPYIHYTLDQDAQKGTSGGLLMNSNACLLGIHVAKKYIGGNNIGIPIDSILVFLTFLNASSEDKSFPVSTSSWQSCGDSNFSTQSNNLLINVCKSYDDEFPSQKNALEWLEEQIESSTIEEFARKWRNSATNDGAIKLIDVCWSYGHKPEAWEHQNSALQYLQSQLSQEIINQFIQNWFASPTPGTTPSPPQL